MKSKAGRSVWAVVAGVLFIIVVTTVVDLVLHAAGIFAGPKEPLTDALALLASSYRLLIGIAGGWLTAKLAPANPMKHALILGIVGTVLGTIGVVATWNLDLGPRWYPISLAVLAIPGSWLGGLVFVKGLRGASA